jgi:hypothetical protein
MPALQWSWQTMTDTLVVTVLLFVLIPVVALVALRNLM